MAQKNVGILGSRFPKRAFRIHGGGLWADELDLRHIKQKKTMKQNKASFFTTLLRAIFYIPVVGILLPILAVKLYAGLLAKTKNARR